MFCNECQNATGGMGIALCGPCSMSIHVGAIRSRHELAGQFLTLLSLSSLQTALVQSKTRNEASIVVHVTQC